MNIFYFLNKYLINHLIIHEIRFVWCAVCLNFARLFHILSKKIIKMHRGNVKNILTSRIKEKHSISQTIVLYPLPFLVFWGRVESLSTGVSLGGGEGRQCSGNLLPLVHSHPSATGSGVDTSHYRSLRCSCMHACIHTKPPTFFSWCLWSTLASLTNQTVVILGSKLRYNASSTTVVGFLFASHIHREAR